MAGEIEPGMIAVTVVPALGRPYLTTRPDPQPGDVVLGPTVLPQPLSPGELGQLEVILRKLEAGPPAKGGAMYRDEAWGAVMASLDATGREAREGPPLTAERLYREIMEGILSLGLPTPPTPEDHALVLAMAAAIVRSDLAGDRARGGVR
jgi:hypothetical protein